MKLKSKNVLITAGIIIVSFMLGTSTIKAQGFYSEQTASDQIASEGGIFRDPGPEGEWGSGGSDSDPAPGGDDPIGEGIVILSLLAGGYSLVKRFVRKKYED